MDQMKTEFNEMRETIKLKTESFKLKQIIYILNEINVLTKPVIISCKCDTNSDNIINKIIVLHQSLQHINDNDNNINNCFQDLNSTDITNKIIESNNYDIDLMDKQENNKQIDTKEPIRKRIAVKRRRRGRPKKSTLSRELSKTIRAKAQKILSKTITKSRKILIKSYNNPNDMIESDLTKFKGKILTDEGKEVFLSRTKRLRCEWFVTNT